MAANNTYNNTSANTRNPVTGNATHNTHNPLTGDGVVNTRNPLTGDKTGPHPLPGTNPVTGRTRDGELGRNEQQYGAGNVGTGTIGATGATGTGITSGTNTHNPLTGDKTGPHHPAATNPVTGRTTGGELGRNEQYGAGHTGVAGTHTGTHTGTDTIHDTTRGTHTGAHPTSTQTSGGGAKALVGKVEATLGNILKNPGMHAKGVQKQEDAHAAKVARTEGAHVGTEVPTRH